MNIVVLSGSPKGKYSITLQTVLYIQKRFPEDCFEIIYVGQQIKQFERDMKLTIEKMLAADLILFCYPVYTFIVPYQLHRFIELIKEYQVDLSGKFAAQISTSKHFYDMTAHKFIEQNCSDLNMKYIHGLSAEMDDLLSEQGQKDALKFWDYVHFCFKSNLYELPKKLPEPEKKLYQPVLPVVKKSDQYNTVIVTNCEDNDQNLLNMISDFQNVYAYSTQVINISKFAFSGGCLGCFNCAASGKCSYRDEFDVFLREEIQKKNAIVYAFTIKDHSMGASFKQYDDRQFCNGHRTVTMGMPMGYIVSGAYSSEHNLNVIIEGRCEVGHNFLCGVATDEGDTPRALVMLADKLTYALQNRLVLPRNFLGVGGMKIFRDIIYLMRGLMKEDHRFYKKHGIYDFVHKKIGTILKMKIVGMLLSKQSIWNKLNFRLNEVMLQPYQKAINKD
ncbi:NAD(P)H-dependent oxidoreductase [Acetivibrio cellulolyticus]|uniref:NAD(P)H-dependent oxidoreductase n=1 Tax=Acetivibrio cellulolyticus TaxID=35830 RepID=UPI0001E300DA|nr:NAD(P)H-dependent oxidoreductase [Acetivibrio cellulolyticus]